MKKTNISNLLQSISVLATLRVVVNGNYSTILKQKLTNYSIYYILYFANLIVKIKEEEEEKKEKSQFNEQSEKFQFNELIQHVPKKKVFESCSRESRSRKLMMERGVKKSDVTCEIAFRPIVSPYTCHLKKEEKKNDKIGLPIGGQRK